jgi:hypothetical protein
MSAIQFRMRLDLITKLQLSAFHYCKNSVKNYDVRNRRKFPILGFESPFVLAWYVTTIRIPSLVSAWQGPTSLEMCCESAPSH